MLNKTFLVYHHEKNELKSYFGLDGSTTKKLKHLKSQSFISDAYAVRNLSLLTFMWKHHFISEMIAMLQFMDIWLFDYGPANRVFKNVHTGRKKTLTYSVSKLLLS